MAYVVSANDFSKIRLNETDIVTSVLQNIALLLRTKRGTCAMYRQFGIRGDVLDRPVNAAPPILYADIKESIEEFEPRAEVVSIDFRIDPSSPGKLIPRVEVRIIG